uniref:Alpha-carbonic anhydrase domain-containing protein n=1 Tax=Anopheles culicifacies TaxID=139723 RepID=A0A182M1B3_9DIPT
MQRSMSRAVQSPVCLMQSQAQIVDDAAPLSFVGHWEDRGVATLTNSGQSAVVGKIAAPFCVFRISNPALIVGSKLKLSDRPYQPFVVGGPLRGVYVFEQLHFHWGPNDTVGCEHLLEGRAHSMEAHLVHYNARYGSFDQALDKDDGLAVAAFLFDAHQQGHDWMPLQPIARALGRIQRAGTSASVPADCLRWLAGLVLDRHYFTYHGSLTTAPYQECVTWLVYSAPVVISSHQSDAFRRSLRTHSLTPITSNFRPVQSPTNAFGLVFVRNCVSTLRSKL